MKNRMLSGIAAIVLGLAIAWGPQFVFKVCAPMARGRFITCHWTEQAEIGAGMFICPVRDQGKRIKPSSRGAPVFHPRVTRCETA